MQLYCGSSRQFVDDTTLNRVAHLMQDSWSAYFGYPPPISEMRAWENSLRALALQISYSRLLDHGVVLEMRLPLTSARLDCLLTGHDQGGREQAVVIELKQWEHVQDSDIDECVATFIGGSVRAVSHPSVQVYHYQQYLVDTLTAFQDDGVPVALSSCSYLHNMRFDPLSPIFATRFKDVLAVAPAFTGDQGDRLSTFLRSRLAAGAGTPVLDKVIHSKYHPSKKLLNHVADMVRGNAVFVLLDDQIVAYNTIITYVRKGLRAKKKTCILINGGPGTGKSLIAINVMAELSRQGINAQYATGSRAFTTNLRRRVGSRAAAQFKYFNSYGQADPDSIDVLLMDEAHRIRESSNSRFTARVQRSSRTQIQELVQAAKVSVFFIDDAQVVRPGEVGSSELVQETAAATGAKLVQERLTVQFRCAGSDGFVRWVDALLQIGDHPQKLEPYTESADFDFRIVDTPYALESLIRERVKEGNTGRIVAGFCWHWSDPNPDGTLQDDVVIGEWRRPWNAKPEAAKLVKGIPRAELWATDPGGIDQIGCVYTAQGFEFDYVGVIVGKDLIWDPVAGRWRGQPEYSCDSRVKRSGERFVSYIKNVYRVLLTRGMKGCYVLFLDEGTRKYVEDHIA
jgi:hypothetical protein